MDKNKIIEAAAKLVAKGAYDKAIKEYQKVLEVDPKDVRILQKMGELYQKKNDNPQAAAYFTKVAENYSSDGFFLKAVALYKQVLKLDASLVDINVRLAELHQQLQLTGEAMAYYQIVANHHDKQGDTRRSLEVLRKMADLDPDNVASRVKLADLYVKEGMTTEALGEFRSVAENLKRGGRMDDYVRVAERWSALETGNLDLARELAEVYLQRGDQKRALAKLQICFKANNRDIATLRLLAVAFQGLGQTSKTVSVYKELARAYEDNGQGSEAEQTWDQVAQLDPSDPDVQARTQAVAPAAPAAPSPGFPQAQAAPPLAPAPPPQRAQPSPAAPKADNIPKLLTETDVYVKYGLHDKALEHLRKVFAIDPENIDAHEKAYAIYVASNNNAQAFEQLLNVLRLHTRSQDAQRAQPFLATMLQQNPGHPEVPVFLSTLRLDGAAAAATPAAADVVDDAILVDSNDEDVIVAEAPEVISGEVALTGEVIEAEDVLDDEVSLDAPAYDFGASDEQLVQDDFDGPAFAEPVTGEHAIVEDDEPPTQSTSIPLTTESGFDGPALGDDEHEAPTRVGMRLDMSQLKTAFDYKSPVAGSRTLKRPPVEERPEDLPFDAPLDSDQVIDEPAFEDEVALEAAAEEPAFADEPAYEAEPAYVEEPVYDEAPAFADEAPAYTDEVPAPAAYDEEAVEAPPDDEPASEECEEAAFFVDQGLFGEAREILETILVAYPDHQRASELLAQVESMEAGGGAAPEGDDQSPDGERDAFDLAAELASELDNFQEEAADPGTSSGSDDYQVSVEEVFAEFKKGLEKVVKPEDVDTHYDLGIAYKEMGLLDDAIGEFTVARRGCPGEKKEVDCLTMIGMLQVMKGDAITAVDSYHQALASPHGVGDTEKALRYELAAAYEGAEQLGKALSQYMRVQAMDERYRDVAQAVERLSALATPEEDGAVPIASAKKGPAGGPGGAPARSRKVGYL